MIKKALLGLVAMIVGLYTTFVLMNCWNWFAIPVFNASSVSFWEMYVLTMLITFFMKQNRGVAKDHRLDYILTVLEVCIPEYKKDEVKELLASKVESFWEEFGIEILKKLYGNSVTLVFGWSIYTFFVR